MGGDGSTTNLGATNARPYVRLGLGCALFLCCVDDICLALFARNALLASFFGAREAAVKANLPETFRL